MGTNYYAHKPACPHCGRGDDPLHIGKSSGGWCFALNTHPEEGINSWPDWLDYFDTENVEILDEYGDAVSVIAMTKCVTERYRDGPCKWSEAEYRLNHAEPGPNNLIRRQIDGFHCVAHGDGTYDLMRGEFS